MCTHTHTHTNTHTRARVHTHKQMNTHTHTHTHTQREALLPEEVRLYLNITNTKEAAGIELGSLALSLPFDQ